MKKDRSKNSGSENSKKSEKIKNSNKGKKPLASNLSKSSVSEEIAHEQIIKEEIDRATEEFQESAEGKFVVESEKERAEEVHPDDCCHIHDHKCKFGFACIAIILVAACAIGEYFFGNERYSKLSEKSSSAINSVRESSEKVVQLEQKVENLSEQLAKISALSASIVTQTPEKLRELRSKWKIWLALKNKLESGDPFDAELKTFRETFSYDKELLAAFDDILKDIDGGSGNTVNENSNNAVMDTVKKYVNKVVKVRKLDHRKLSEISGYVITSIEF